VNKPGGSRKLQNIISPRKRLGLALCNITARLYAFTEKQMIYKCNNEFRIFLIVPNLKATACQEIPPIVTHSV